MIYGRFNPNVWFLIPAVAIGVDLDGRYFFEVALLSFAVGIGEKPN